MKLSIRAYNFDYILSKPLILNQLKELNGLKDGADASGMMHQIEKFKTLPNKNSLKIILAYHSHKIIGWAMVTKENKLIVPYRMYRKELSDYHEFQIYIHQDFRQRGFGSQIVSFVKKYYPNLGACWWDIKSEKFFFKNNINGKFYADF